jgi:hypothetical protein
VGHAKDRLALGERNAARPVATEPMGRHRDLVELGAADAGLLRGLIELGVDPRLDLGIFHPRQNPGEIGHASAVGQLGQRPDAGVAEFLRPDAGAPARHKALLERIVGEHRADVRGGQC